jgi:hypothetical protein
MEHRTISIDADDETHSADYELEQGIVTVITSHGRKSAPAGTSPPEIVARMLLRELLAVETMRREGII